MNRHKVEAFNHLILNVVPPEKPQLMDQDSFRLSLAQLREEVKEMEEAYEKGDLVGVVDACIDLDYFLMGVIYKMGIDPHTYDQMFSVVHKANMAKKLGVKDTRQGFNGAADAVKPEGWEAPEKAIRRILGV